MLYLILNTTNPISIDAPQTVTTSTPFYYFQFEDIQTQETYSGYIDKLNSSSERFGEFEVVLPTAFDMPSGEYIYQVFESEDEIETDTDNLTLLEKGMAVVIATIETNEFYNAPTLTSSVYANS